MKIFDFAKLNLSFATKISSYGHATPPILLDRHGLQRSVLHPKAQGQFAIHQEALVISESAMRSLYPIIIKIVYRAKLRKKTFSCNYAHKLFINTLNRIMCQMLILRFPVL